MSPWPPPPTGTPWAPRLVSLRDFLLLFFFLNLGAQLDFTDAARQFTEAAVFSVFVLVGNPIIVLLIMAAMRYPVRVGFLAGLTVAQISEFSLILAALGLSLGHIGSETVSLITVVGLITIGVSTYLILYSHAIYGRLKRWLAPLERRGVRDPAETAGARVDVIQYGLGRFGGQVADHLAATGYRVLAVDFDPQRVAARDGAGLTTVFGSAEDLDFLETLPLGRARLVVSTIPAAETNLALLHALRHHDYRGRVALTAHTSYDAERLRAAGADLVLEPFNAAATSTLAVLSGELGSTPAQEDRKSP